MEVSAWYLFSAVRKGLPVSSETAFADSVSKPFGAFKPVPTAVPPSAREESGGMLARISSRSVSRELRQPLISWEKEIGTASWRWVLPDFTMPL